jgi:recombination protein RecA
MGRKSNAEKNDELESLASSLGEETTTIYQTKKPLGLDVAKLVEKAQGRFGKNKALYANSMKVSNEITMSNDPDDYVGSEQIAQFWKPLTNTLGCPYGRIVQIAGRPDSGKTTLGMLFMKSAQDAGTLVILWDSEGKFDSNRFRDRMGGDPSQVPVAMAKGIVEGVQEVVAYVKAAKEMNPEQKILIIWDSVGASVNSAEDEENDDYSKQPGVTAKEVSWAIRRFNQLMEKYRDEDGKYTMGVLCINQVYANIGSVGNKQKGGAELEYLSSIILEMSRKSNLTRTRAGQKIKYGILTKARVVKNHLFSGEDCVAELELVVNASGISLGKTDDLDEDE